MYKKIIKKMLAKRGFDLRKIVPEKMESESFKLFSYLSPDGSFDYERYRKIQEAGNKDKLHQVWVKKENIDFISEYLRNNYSADCNFGICHGTRRGKEQQWFREYMDCEVIGTEISDTATQFEHTIKWDFHEVKPEWKNSVDFIYSNAFDHSHDPEKCLNAWISCLKPGGFCFIEHSEGHSTKSTSELDPFGAHIAIMPYLIANWSKGRYGVRELLKAPVRRDYSKYHYIIVVWKYPE
jgi:hypothetical protein